MVLKSRYMPSLNLGWWGRFTGSHLKKHSHFPPVPQHRILYLSFFCKVSLLTQKRKSNCFILGDKVSLPIKQRASEEKVTKVQIYATKLLFTADLQLESLFPQVLGAVSFFACAVELKDNA